MACEKQLRMNQIFRFLSPMWETWRKLPAPGFSLAWFHPWGHLRNKPEDRRFLLCPYSPLSVILTFKQINNSLENKNELIKVSNMFQRKNGRPHFHQYPELLYPLNQWILLISIQHFIPHMKNTHYFFHHCMELSLEQKII